MNLQDTLNARKSRYGDFSQHAAFAQRLKMVCRAAASWNMMTVVQQEGLDMIMHKVACAICGDPNYADTWHDIAGYARLIEERCEEGK